MRVDTRPPLAPISLEEEIRSGERRRLRLVRELTAEIRDAWGTRKRLPSANKYLQSWPRGWRSGPNASSIHMLARAFRDFYRSSTGSSYAASALSRNRHAFVCSTHVPLSSSSPREPRISSMEQAPIGQEERPIVLGEIDTFLIQSNRNSMKRMPVIMRN